MINCYGGCGKPATHYVVFMVDDRNGHGHYCKQCAVNAVAGPAA